MADTLPMIDIWYHCPAAALLDAYLGATTAAEHKRAGGFRREADAIRFLASRALARVAVGRHLGISAAEISFSRRCEHCGDPEHGRPTVLTPGDPVEFSLTRAGRVVAVAVAPAPVGLDAEPTRDGMAELLGSEMFSEEEQAWICSGDQDCRILQLWVAKEAVGKVSGLGLLDASRIRALPTTPSWRGATDALGRPCWVTGLVIPGSVAASVATYLGPSPLALHLATPEWF
jgi:4'-phosphopantetheinyl transferase